MKTSVLEHLSKGFALLEDDFDGWLEVPYQLLVDLNIQHQISRKSKRIGNKAYLVEAFDFPMFIAAFARAIECNVMSASMIIFKHERFEYKHQSCTAIRKARKFYMD